MYYISISLQILKPNTGMDVNAYVYTGMKKAKFVFLKRYVNPSHF